MNRNVIATCPKCGRNAQLRESRERSLADPADFREFLVIHLEKSGECPDYGEPWNDQF